MNTLCDCTCIDKCPLGKMGSEDRCSIEELSETVADLEKALASMGLKRQGASTPEQVQKIRAIGGVGVIEAKKLAHVLNEKGFLEMSKSLHAYKSDKFMGIIY